METFIVNCFEYRHKGTSSVVEKVAGDKILCATPITVILQLSINQSSSQVNEVSQPHWLLCISIPQRHTEFTTIINENPAFAYSTYAM